jgi:hypothetical protein
VPAGLLMTAPRNLRDSPPQHSLDGDVVHAEFKLEQ